MYGGAALPGRFGERDVTILDSYEAVGRGGGHWRS
jgi:hypothetical protein